MALTPTGRQRRGYQRRGDGALQRRLALLAGERQSKRADAAVQRVLALLSDENLALEAARSADPRVVRMECGVLAQVWEDPRVYNRRYQLTRQGVSVERETVTTEIAGRTFVRERLCVHF